MSRPPVKLMFLDNIKDTHECVLWPFPVDKDGYGRLSITIDGKKIYTSAHAHSCLIYNGNRKSDNQIVLHTCDKPSCVNPKHLKWGNQSENIFDRFTKGRCARGENHGMSKLTNSIINEIRNSAESCRELAKKYSVTHSAISRVRRNETWKEQP